MPLPQEFTPEQLAYIESQVNAQAGFTFVSANISGTDKLHMEFTKPAGGKDGLSQSARNNQDWLTNDGQFKAVVAEAVDNMVKHHS